MQTHVCSAHISHWTCNNTYDQTLAPLLSHITCKTTYVQHFWATCTQYNSPSSTSEPHNTQDTSRKQRKLKKTRARHHCSIMLLFSSETLVCFAQALEATVHSKSLLERAYLFFGCTDLLRPTHSNRLCSVLTYSSHLRRHCTASNFTLIDFTGAVRRHMRI